jgi:hypothetical protein
MGVYLRWKQATGATYTHTYIYRADSETGTYSEIHNQSYSDTNYYDIEGTTANWYKIRFYDSVTTRWSEYSDAFQAGTWNGYCTIQDIRDVTNLSESDITDANICRLIALAGQHLNQQISVYIEDERVSSIDDEKTNDINGTNTTFYTVYYPVGDFNNTFKVTTSDIKVYEIDSSTTPATRTELTVSSITPNTGGFVLSTAPTADKKLLLTYRYVPLSVSDPHPLIRLACMFLTAAFAYQKINVGKSPRFKMGNVQIQRDMDSFKTYMQRYSEILLDINNRSMVDIKTAPSIPGIDAFAINISIPERSKTV